VKLNCILLIDDDKLTNFLNKIVIDKACLPIRVIKKESAQAGLKYLLETALANRLTHFPDLILLDIDMPGLDGWQFIESYTELKPSLPSNPVILMLSSFDEPKYFLKASGLPDLSGIYIKPLSEQTINTIIPQFFDV